MAKIAWLIFILALLAGASFADAPEAEAENVESHADVAHVH